MFTISPDRQPFGPEDIIGGSSGQVAGVVVGCAGVSVSEMLLDRELGLSCRDWSLGVTRGRHEAVN